MVFSDLCYSERSAEPPAVQCGVCEGRHSHLHLHRQGCTDSQRTGWGESLWKQGRTRQDELHLQRTQTG